MSFGTNSSVGHAFIDVQTLSSNIAVMGCRFDLNGTSAPSGLSGQGFKAVSRLAQGKYRATLNEPWFGCVAFGVTLEITLADGRRAMINTVTARGAAPAVDVCVVDQAGAYQDVATEDGGIIDVILYMYKGAPN